MNRHKKKGDKSNVTKHRIDGKLVAVTNKNIPLSTAPEAVDSLSIHCFGNIPQPEGKASLSVPKASYCLSRKLQILCYYSVFVKIVVYRYK